MGLCKCFEFCFYYPDKITFDGHIVKVPYEDLVFHFSSTLIRPTDLHSTIPPAYTNLVFCTRITFALQDTLAETCQRLHDKYFASLDDMEKLILPAYYSFNKLILMLQEMDFLPCRLPMFQADEMIGLYYRNYRDGESPFNSGISLFHASHEHVRSLHPDALNRSILNLKHSADSYPFFKRSIVFSRCLIRDHERFDFSNIREQLFSSIIYDSYRLAVINSFSSLELLIASKLHKALKSKGMDDFKIESLLKSNWKFGQRLKEPFIKAFGNTFGEILKSQGRETLWQDLVSKGTSILDLRNRIVHSA